MEEGERKKGGSSAETNSLEQQNGHQPEQQEQQDQQQQHYHAHDQQQNGDQQEQHQQQQQRFHQVPPHEPELAGEQQKDCEDGARADSSDTPAERSSAKRVGSLAVGGGGLARLAHRLTINLKDKADERGRSNGFMPHDDLPLGSEANSLRSRTIDETGESRRNGRPDPRLMHGWQSFNSDVSNHTTASSASLEMLLNTRQVDPEIMLRNLGFGGNNPSILPSLERVPERFLDHPSQAYGIDVPGLEEPGEEDCVGNGVQGNRTDGSSSSPSGGSGGGGSGAVTPATGRRKPKTGIWTVARTLSMFGNLNRQIHGHGGASPVSGVPPGSVLNVPNQLYLASQGFYKQQNKEGKSEHEKSSKRSKPEKIQEDEEVSEADTSNRTSGSAASKRRMFQKTRSRTTWSLCDDSGDEGGAGGGGNRDKKYSTTSTNSDWVTQSLDESLSREDSTGIDDSSSKFAYFSTTTESSTDSVDRNSDSEKALEEIRQQYKEGQLGLLPKKERSSSEDLFLPRRSSKSRDAGVDGEERNSISSSSGGRYVRFGDLSDEDDDDAVRRNSGVDDDGRGVIGNEDLDLLRASLDNYNGGNGGGRYFISPVNSRQATVEKAPSVVDHSYQPDGEAGGGIKNGVNDHNDNNNNGIVDEFISSENTSSLQSSVKSRNSGGRRETPPGQSDVRIVVSNSTEVLSDSSVAPPTGESSRLGVAGKIQRASSDSGSSSSGTAVGSSSVVTMTTDDLDTLRLSESENSITDRDSISRTNSPSGFLQPWGQGQGLGNQGQGRPEVELVSCGVQTSSEDLEELLEMSRTSDTADGKLVDDRQMAGRNSNGFQLSSLPAGINPVQLMRRLHNSQDELLPRMSSLQSDSSGFGDGEPGLESGTTEGGGGGDNLVKVANLGSSSESNGTIASSVTTAIMMSQPRKGETATQTSVDESQSDISQSQTDSTDVNDNNFKPARYISHCIILHQASKNAKDSSKHDETSDDNIDNDEPIQPTKQNPSHRRPSYFSTPLSPSEDPSLNDYYYYQHQFCDDEEEYDHRHPSSNSFISSRNHPGLIRNGRRMGGRNYSATNRIVPDIAGQTFFNYDPAPRGYVPSVPFPDHHFNHPHHHRPHHHRHHLHHYSLDQEDHFNLDDSDPHHSPTHSNKRHHHHRHHRRHSKSSDEFIDNYEDNDTADSLHRAHHSHHRNRKSRNQTPLSEELAEASFSLGNSSAPANSHLSSPSSLRSPPAMAASTPVCSTDGNNNDKDRVVSSVDVFVNADGTHRASSTRVTPARSTPKFRFSVEEIGKVSEADRSPNLHCPPLAGNLTGVRVQSEDDPAPSTTYANTKTPLFLSQKNSRQKSCDILDDDDEVGQENRFFKIVGGGREEDYANSTPGFSDEDGAAKATGISATVRSQYPEFTLLQSVRHGKNDNNSNENNSNSGSSGIKSSPVMPMTFLPRDSQDPRRSASLQNMHSSRTGSGRFYPSPTSPLSRTWDDLEGGYSSVNETSSEFSIRSMPVGAGGRVSNGVLDSQKLARLVNRPSNLRSKRRRPTSYHPRRSFREWNVLSRRKRLMEEDRLLQHSIHKYKTEMSLMQATFLNEYGKAFHEMTQEEREEMKEVEYLWGEVNGQIAEMEDLVNSRVQSLHSGNDFHSLLSSLGIIDQTIELLKEQIYQQQVLSGHVEDGQCLDDLEDFDEFEDDISSRGSMRSTQSMMEGLSPHWRRPSSRSSLRTPSNSSRMQSSSSTSNLPSDINLSLEEMKSSLLKEIKNEIKVSTQKLEDSLTKKDLEIQELRKRLASSKAPPPIPSTPAAGKGRLESSSSFPTPTKMNSTKVQRRQQAWIARSRSRVVGDRVVRETDI